MKKKLFCVFKMLIFPFFVFAGGELIGNGGGFLPSQIIREAYNLHTRFKNGELKHIKELKKLTSKRFLDAIQETNVKPVEGPIFDNKGIEVDARFIVNKEGVKIIEVNRVVWLKYLTLELEFSILVLHEYLRVLGINDDQYRVSEQIKKTSASDNSLYYDLMRSFEKGERVNVSDIQGAYSGRCFSKYSVISKTASALIIENISTSSSEKKLHIVEGIPEVNDAEENYFDDFTYQGIVDYISYLSFDFSEPYTFAGDLTTDYIAASSQLRLRKSKGTLISVYTSLRSQIIEFPWGDIKVKKNEDWTACYYLDPKTAL